MATPPPKHCPLWLFYTPVVCLSQLRSHQYYIDINWIAYFSGFHYSFSNILFKFQDLSKILHYNYGYLDFFKQWNFLGALYLWRSWQQLLLSYFGEHLLYTLKNIQLLLCICVCAYVHECMCTHCNTHVEVRGSLARVIFSLAPCAPWGLHSSHQAWQQMLSQSSLFTSPWNDCEAVLTWCFPLGLWVWVLKRTALEVTCMLVLRVTSPMTLPLATWLRLELGCLLSPHFLLQPHSQQAFIHNLEVDVIRR